MLNFLHRSAKRHPSSDVLQALIAAGLPGGPELSTLGIVHAHGRYAGRKVHYFRVFEPRPVAVGGAQDSAGYTYDELTARPDLVLRAGFIEQDGTVVIYAQERVPSTTVPRREPTDRLAHADDERFVFPITRRYRLAGEWLQ
jgi:hypothetical protein